MSEQLTYENWQQEKVDYLIETLPDYTDILKWAFSEYKNHEIIYACSFGAEGIVLIDLLNKFNKNTHIVFLDTGLHFPETYHLIEKIKTHYPSLQIKMIKPALTLDEQAEKYGEKLWTINPNQCCYLRKIVPFEEALEDTKAWISGLRREQSPTRKQTRYINRDERFKKIKICPLIHWTWDDVMTYIRLNNLPYNPLHDQNFPSIGCAPCTRAVSKGEDPRSGHSAGHAKTECGLHGSGH